MHLRRTCTTIVIAVTTALTLAACSSGTKSASTPTTIAVTAPTAPRSTTTAARDCRPAASYTPGTSIHHLTVAREQRVFLVHMPPHPTTGMWLVVDFHGATSDMQQQDLYSGFDSVADQHGFVVATPNGIDAAVRQWRFLGTPNDVPFAIAIVQTLARDACVDPAHAYAVGISSGAAMSASLACQASTTFAGFGLVSADFYLPPLCAKARQRPIVIFHGTADPVVPYYGGHVGNANGLPVGAAEASAAAWADHNGCRGAPTSTPLGTQVVRLTWNGCAAPVVMYRIVGGGHTWPGAAIALPTLGLTTRQVSATAVMWKFFVANG